MPVICCRSVFFPLQFFSPRFPIHPNRAVFRSFPPHQFFFFLSRFFSFPRGMFFLANAGSPPAGFPVTLLHWFSCPRSTDFSMQFECTWIVPPRTVCWYQQVASCPVVDFFFDFHLTPIFLGMAQLTFPSSSAFLCDYSRILALLPSWMRLQPLPKMKLHNPIFSPPLPLVVENCLFLFVPTPSSPPSKLSKPR